MVNGNVLFIGDRTKLEQRFEPKKEVKGPRMSAKKGWPRLLPDPGSNRWSKRALVEQRHAMLLPARRKLLNTIEVL